MAKEKVQQIELKDNERLFHYEILGIIILILSIFAITKMGLIGLYLLLIIKVLFGDWYFLILMLLIAYAIRCIIFHNKLSIINIRYLGVFLIILSLILLSHFSMHKYVKNYDENNLVLTLRLYLNFFKNKAIDSIVGGGIIGSIIFYIGYYLLSEFGVVFLSLILIFIGSVFITKKTIKDFILLIFVFIKKIYEMFHKTRNKLKSNIDAFDNSYKKNKIHFKISKVDNNKYYNQELEISKRNVEIIKKTLNGMNVFYNEISYIICRNITVYFIESYYKYSFDVFYRNISKYIHNIQLKVDDNDGNLIIEVNNLNPVPLRISELNTDNKDIIIGIDDRNNFIKLDSDNNKMFLFSKNKVLSTDYLDTVILSLIHFKIKIEYYYLDLYKISMLSTSNTLNELDDIITALNNKISLFNSNNVSNIIDYNKKSSKKISNVLIIINGFNDNYIDNSIYEKILYLIETSNNYGYYFIFTSSDGLNKYADLYNQFNYKLFLEQTGSYAKHCLSNVDYKILSSNCEGYLVYKSLTIRMCLLMLTEYEKNNIK